MSNEEYGIIPPIITQEQAEAMRPAENLKPSPHGEECPHNGEHPGIEIACDECDFFLQCFPEYGKGYTKLSGLADGVSVTKYRAVATMQREDGYQWDITLYSQYETLAEAQAGVERFKKNYAQEDSPVSVVATRIEEVPQN